MHDGMPYGRNQGQGQGHSREVDRQSPTGLIIIIIIIIIERVRFMWHRLNSYKTTLQCHTQYEKQQRNLAW